MSSSNPAATAPLPLLKGEQKRQLLQAAMDARAQAYCPYSNFRVGAALLTSTNSIVPGANVENASYGAGICAERTALVKAMTQQPSSSNSLQDAYERPSIIAIAVASDLPSSPCSPCGICRQFIREFCALSMPVYMVWNEWDGAAAADDDDEIATKGVLVKTLEELLPLSFGPEHLHR